MNLRLNVAVKDLVENHHVETRKAMQLCEDLEAVTLWIVRFGLVIARTNRKQMPVHAVRKWLVKHAYMTERDARPLGAN